MAENNKTINGYDLARNWFNFCFDNPELINPNHTAIYLFAVEHCNRLGWKIKFGFPSQMTMDAIGIRKHSTYIRYFRDLVEWKFFILIQESKNQYSSNIISLSNALPKIGEALDEAIVKHGAKQTLGTGQSNSTVIKLLTSKPFKLLNKEYRDIILKWINFEKEDNTFNFKNSLLDLGIEKQIVSDYLKVRSKKKATNSETAFKKIKTEIEKSGITANECIKKAVEKSWAGFESSWLINIIGKIGTTNEEILKQNDL